MTRKELESNVWRMWAKWQDAYTDDGEITKDVAYRAAGDFATHDELFHGWQPNDYDQRTEDIANVLLAYAAT